MKKRFLCTLLILVVLIGVVHVSAVRADAASTLTASDSCISLIKSLEGFVSTPVWDYSHYSVGYGSTCEAGDYPNGITEEEADALLRADVAKIETKINNFADKKGLTLSQNRFDALVSFTYNVGSGWMSDSEGMFLSAVVNGSTGNDFIFAITRWSSVTVGNSKTVSIGLVNRRLIEANMYLNGVYSGSVPANYSYVLFDNNIEDCTNSVRVQGYDTNVGDNVRATPTKSGYRFLGWYSEADGGKWITGVNGSTAGATLYGHWQAGDGEVDANGAVVGTAASYTVYISAAAAQSAYRQPSTNAAVVRVLGAGEAAAISADYMDAGGVKWGQLSDGSWLCLSTVTFEASNSGNTGSTGSQVGALDEPLLITVTSNGVNIRSGPGTNYSKVGTANKEDQFTITAVQQGGNYLWGQFSTGWICLDYTDYEIVLAESTQAEVTATGVVNVNKLNVRSGPGTNYSLVGYLYEGDQVTITTQTKVGSTTWGLTEYGWVSLYYVDVTPVEQVVSESTPMYRLYNPNSGEHFYTGSVEERDNLITAGWAYEGIAWNAPVTSGEPVYRLYNPNSGDHHYTMSEEEKDNLVDVGWKYEGVAWNSASPDNLPLYRLYNPNADCGSHHYTGSEEERDNLVSVGWIYEGIGWYGMLN